MAGDSNDDGSGPNGQRPGIPSWQRSTPSDESKPQAADASKTSSAEQQQESKSLVERAQHWLQDETVRNSPTADKVAFLKSKGLSEANIKSALEFTTSDSTPTSSATTIGSDTTSMPSSPSSTAPTTSSLPSPAIAPKRDIPPIITYPEFLVHSSKPPPLITARRLANTAYFAAGASALVYGASKYLVTPMTDSLNAARHDFAHHTQEQLNRLNTALEGIVSTDPAASNVAAHRRHLAAEENSGEASDDDTEDSDPTELFHRDFGTQTADLPATPDSSSSSTAASDANGLNGASSTAAESQACKLHRLRDLCDELTTEEKSEADTQHEIGAALKILDEQLQSMSVPVGGFGGYGGGASGGWEVPGSNGGGQWRRRADDEISKIKVEIRSVKGVLLSAKHFPGGNGGSGGSAGRVNAMS